METMYQEDTSMGLLLPSMNELTLSDDFESLNDYSQLTPRSSEESSEEDDSEESSEEDDDEEDIDRLIIKFDPNDTEELPLDVWLDKYPPSETFEEGMAWIRVWSKNPDKDYCPDTEGLYKALEKMKLRNTPISHENLIHLAMNYNVTGGKWMFYVETGYKVDLLWSLVATGFVSGTLGNFASYTRVSPVNLLDDRYRHVISIYNSNFNEAEVYALENEIRLSGIKCEMKYKPDVYSHCGVYLKNLWDLRPTIFSSIYDIPSHSSIIWNHQTDKMLTKFVDSKRKDMKSFNA